MKVEKNQKKNLSLILILFITKKLRVKFKKNKIWNLYLNLKKLQKMKKNKNKNQAKIRKILKKMPKYIAKNKRMMMKMKKNRQKMKNPIIFHNSRRKFLKSLIPGSVINAHLKIRLN